MSSIFTNDTLLSVSTLCFSYIEMLRMGEIGPDVSTRAHGSTAAYIRRSPLRGVRETNFVMHQSEGPIVFSHALIELKVQTWTRSGWWNEGRRG